MAGSDPQKVSNYSSLLIHWTDPQESQDNATRIDELQRQTELDRIEIEKELELGLENSHSLSDEDNQNEMEFQSIEKSDTRYKCSGQSQPPPSYQNQMQSGCGVVGPDLEVGQTKVNLLTYQEPEVKVHQVQMQIL